MALSDSLISYWSLDEASGDALDAHSTNDLTDNNTVGAGTGVVNGARDFEDGNFEYFSLADNAALSTGDIDFTIAAWCNFESTGSTRNIAAKREGVGNLEYYLRIHLVGPSDYLFNFEVSPDGSTPVASLDASTFGAVSTSTWYFVVAMHDSVNNELRISVNAGTQDTLAHSGGVYDGTAAFRIGAGESGGERMDGLIDEVGFWKRCLTTAEITELYNSGSGRDYSYITSGGGGLSIPIAMHHYKRMMGVN